MAPGKLQAIAAVLRFCTDSVYAAGDVCPAAQPSSGGGTCYNMPITPGVCYTWVNFPCAPAAIIGNVNYAHVPSNFTGCSLYDTDDCTTTEYSEWDSLGTGSYNLLCRYHLGGKVQSWKCDA